MLVRVGSSTVALALTMACGPTEPPGDGATTEGTDTIGGGIDLTGDPPASTGPAPGADDASGATGDDCPAGEIDCPCAPGPACAEGLGCNDGRCGAPTCVDEPHRSTSVTLEQGGRTTVMDIVWFDYWTCSTFAGLLFKPQGVEFGGHSPPPEGRMFFVDDPQDWWLVGPGQVFSLVHEGSDASEQDYGTLELLDIERTPVGRPMAFDGTIDAGGDGWTLSGTFHATPCGNGWGPGFPCE